MAKWNLEALSDRERACLGHLEQAKRLGVSFSRWRELFPVLPGEGAEAAPVGVGQAGLGPQRGDQ